MTEFKIVRRAENGAEITTETMDVFPTLEEAVIALKNRKRNYDTSCTDDVVESNETIFRIMIDAEVKKGKKEHKVESYKYAIPALHRYKDIKSYSKRFRSEETFDGKNGLSKTTFYNRLGRIVGSVCLMTFDGAPFSNEIKDGIKGV